MKVLVLASKYPNLAGDIPLMFAHVRNIYYQSRGINVTVLNFNATEKYEIDGITVITKKQYKHYKNQRFDLLIAHAPNIRNHYMFLKQYVNNFKKTVFFIHGHEMLKINEAYPKPYFFSKKSNKLRVIFQDIYDTVKLFLWRKYFIKNLENIHIVFVSTWILDAFITYTKIPLSIIKNRHSIIHNQIGKPFEDNSYTADTEKLYDFITIRSNFDDTKYAIDIVNNLAKANPVYSFLVIGRGEFFRFNEKSTNIKLIEKTLKHDEILSYINQSRCALMPTRQDTQGVMACEIATFGIPLITSDIDVCRDIFSEFDNVALIDNEYFNIDLTPILKRLLSNIVYKKSRRFYSENTVQREVDLFTAL